MNEGEIFVHETSYIDEPIFIGKGTKIWHFCHIMSNCKIGEDCVLGQNVHLANDVIIGNHVKIQNNVSVFSGVTLEDFVFCGPSCVFTNVVNPRSEINRHEEYQRTIVRRGASIGANATIKCGVEIGRYAFVGAGAVVTRNIPDYGLVVGVPAKQVGWFSRHGYQLKELSTGLFIDPVIGWKYQLVSPNIMKCLEWPEDQSLKG